MDNHTFPAGIDSQGFSHESSDSMSPLDYLIRSNNLDEGELTELYRTVGALQAHSMDKTPSSATTGVLGLLRDRSPKVQKVITDLFDMMNNSRDLPFTEKYSPEQHAQQLFDNPSQAMAIHGALQHEDIAAGLHSRMGTQRTSTANDTSGRRSAIEDAYDNLFPKAGG